MENSKPTNISPAIKAMPNQAVDSVSTESTKISKTNKSLLIILIILLVISLVASGIFAYLYFSNSAQETTSNQVYTPEVMIADNTEEESESNTAPVSLVQAEDILRGKYDFDVSIMVAFDGWHEYIKNFNQANKILFTIHQLWHEDKLTREQIPENCDDPNIYNIGFEEFIDAYIYYFGNTEPLERKDYQFESLISKAVYNLENDGFDIYFPNCVGGYSTERLLSRVDNVTETNNGFKATVLTVTLDSEVRKNAKDVLGPGIIGGMEYYTIPMTDETLEEIRDSLSAYEFNFINEAGEYKLVSINKI